MTTYAEKLKRARKPRRTVDICLAGDLIAEYERLEKQLAEAQQAPVGQSMEDSGARVEIAEKIEALRTEMRAFTEEFVLEALSGKKYRALKAEHPPRQNDEGEVIDSDRALDVNMDEFAGPLIRACLVSPVLDDEEWAATEEALTDRQWDDLVAASIWANEGRVNIPFSRAASAILASSEPE